MSLRIFIGFLLAILLRPETSHARIELPSLGEASSAVISTQQERELGQSWLRSFRSQAEVLQDPLIQEYVEDMLKSMAQYAPLEDRRLDVLIVENASLNAFAVPGGVIGVHTGLFMHADSEAAFASVMAHEISHLSQRHFARSVAERQTSARATMAGVLASVLLAATVGGDAALAAISATQAASLESGLKYSRQNEQEADRIGIELLNSANYNPEAMTDMFEAMLKATRYTGYQAPEYLRSHPLTESRVNDAGARARRYAKRYYASSDVYPLIRARAEVLHSGSPEQAVQKFRARLELEDTDVDQYALALALVNAFQLKPAFEIAEPLCQQEPTNKYYNSLCVQLLSSFGDYEQASDLLNQLIVKNPSSYALQMSKAQLKNQAGEFDEAADILEQLSRERPNDAQVFYEFAETLGLAGRILDLHKARANYFLLVGGFERAIRQLQFAKKEVQGNSIELAILDERISQAARLRSSEQL